MVKIYFQITQPIFSLKTRHIELLVRIVQNLLVTNIANLNCSTEKKRIKTVGTSRENKNYAATPDKNEGSGWNW